MSYDQSASVYDVIYGSKNYEAEAERVHALVQRYSRIQAEPGYVPTLLDVACGTGKHLQFLKEWYWADGMDFSEAQLAIARERLGEAVHLRRDDMRTFGFDKKYDAVTCLFSAIGHMTTPDDLKSAITNMADHLVIGGVLIIEPWITPDVFRPGFQRADQVTLGDMSVIRVSRTLRKGNITELVMDHYISRNGQYEDPFTERHEVAMWAIPEYLKAFQAAGLEAWFEDDTVLTGRGLLIGRKDS